MEKTFNELIEESDYSFTNDGNDTLMHDTGILELMQQVREATITEIENKANEYGEYGTADYAHQLPIDRIKLTKETE